MHNLIQTLLTISSVMWRDFTTITSKLPTDTVNSEMAIMQDLIEEGACQKEEIVSTIIRYNALRER